MFALNRIGLLSASEKPAFRMIVVATGEYAFRRKDGIIVAPLSSLKP